MPEIGKFYKSTSKAVYSEKLKETIKEHISFYM